MEKKIKLVGEREIGKETKHFKISHIIVDILLPIMLNNIDNASKLNEEDFYLLDSLIKCKLLFCNIDIQDDYSENVENLLKYCKEENINNTTNGYTYVYLTNNNIDTLIKWLLDEIQRSNKLTIKEEKILDDLIFVKKEFYENKFDESIINTMKEIEKIKIIVNNGD